MSAVCATEDSTVVDHEVKQIICDLLGHLGGHPPGPLLFSTLMSLKTGLRGTGQT